jgi:class 3 adenylate cyclase
MTDAATLDRARTAFEGHAWLEAFDALSKARDLAGEDLQRLGEAAWWSGHPNESLEAFGRAFTAYEAEENPRAAALVALRLALEHADRGETAVWHAWLQRAVRLLADQPDCVEHGYLELVLVRSSADRGDIEDAMRHAVAANEIGTRFRNRDVEAFSQVLQGALLVYQTDVERGLRMIDEGTLAAVGGELTPFLAGSLYCVTIGVCRSVADYRRAGQWTEAAARWCERESITGFPGVCKVGRAEILRLRGSLAEAEEEARAALVELEKFGRLPQAGGGAHEIGEVRLRLGDLDAAEAAFEQAHRLGFEPQPGIALLRLARGEIDAARSSIGTALADIGDPLERARLLPARVEIALAAHDLAEAREAAEELRAAATTFDQPTMHAAAHEALGRALTYEEKPEEAIPELRSAVRHWTEADTPFETAHARRCLALAYRSSGDEASALLELRAAKAVFERLGARLDVERCDELIRAGRERDAGRRVFRTFMFTDIVGSTSLIESIGDEAWEDLLRWHDETLTKAVAAHRGEVVHGTGDGFFASFDDAESALACAVAIQRRLTEHRRAHGFAPAVRIGIHAAEATVMPGDYAGLGVHEAARVGAIAEGGEILATASTVGVSGAGVAVNEREVTLKGIARPVRVVNIDWRA